MPTSQKQIDANRRNAQKSTGPRTDAGKAESRRNAVVHALTGEELGTVNFIALDKRGNVASAGGSRRVHSSELRSSNCRKDRSQCGDGGLPACDDASADSACASRVR